MSILRDAQPGAGLNVFALWEGHAGRGRRGTASVSRPGATGDLSQVSKTSAAEQQVLRLLRSGAGATCTLSCQGLRAARRAYATYQAAGTTEAFRPGPQARTGADPADNAWPPGRGKSISARARPARLPGPCCGPRSCGGGFRRGDPAFPWPARAQD